jgi:hypothetical protein
MDRRSPLRKIPRALLRLEVLLAAAALTLLAAMPPALAQNSASAAAGQPSDTRCLGCHGSPGMEKTLGDGGTLKLHIPGDTFAKSVHSAVGCAGCHSDVDLSAHPPAKNEIAGARSFSVAMTQVCRGCHTDKFDQWETSIHAALVRSKNPAAPVCTDCHNPHGVIKGAAESIQQIPCKNCHTDIYNAYLGSMHAKARLASPQSSAPVCSGCHSAHAVKPTSLGQGPKEACLGCHADVLEAHQKWLPNAGLHFEVVSCPACHAPTAQRKVDLMLIDAKDAQPLGTEQLGVPLFEASSESNGQGIDAQTLWNLLQTLNRSGVAVNTALRGRLEVSTGPQKHALAEKSKAISDCHTCHSAGSQAFQSVTISLVKPEGQRVGYGANADVLNSVMSIQSVGGFYAIGATRIKLLDILLVLAILGGLGFAVGHVALGWVFKYLGLYHPAIGGHRETTPGRPGDGQGPTSA